MNLEKHINIIYKNTYLNENINFLDLWKKVFQKIYPNNKPNFSDPGWMIRINKSFYLTKYFLSNIEIKGDFLECGVFKGFSSLLLIELEKLLNNQINNNYFLIDSFEGLSEILEEDKPKNKDVFRNQQGNLRADIKDVEKRFVEYQNVNILKGWIPKIFNVLDESNKYKFIHIDVDLYQPTLDTLEYFYDKVVKGGIIITDDYEAPLFPGNKKAWQKFMYAKDLSYFVLPSGQAVIIKE